MPTRREFILSAAGTAVLLSVGGCAALGSDGNAPESAIAITQIFGDGMRLTAVAVKYRRELAAAPDKAQYSVAGRTVERVYLAQSADGAPADRGRFVIIQLNPYDDGALLTTSLPTPTPPKTARAKRATKTTARPH